MTGMTGKKSTGTRTVYCEDALGWLESRPVQEGCSFITSLPDFSEFPSMTLDEWKIWFMRAAGLVLSRCPDDGVTIFFQTDLKTDGAWVDKGFLIQKAALEAGHELISHKIVCRVPPGTATFGRPGYSHMLCFSRGVRENLSTASGDVLGLPGEVTWTRGMGVEACLAACRFVMKNASASRVVVDPFCGHGTVLAAANFLGLDAVGVELGGKRARKSRALRLVEFTDAGGKSRKTLHGGEEEGTESG